MYLLVQLVTILRKSGSQRNAHDIQCNEVYVYMNTVYVQSTAAGLWHSSTLWAQVEAEEELGACSPTVLQGNIMAILLDGVRVRRNDQYSILHKRSKNSSKNRVCTSTYSVYISMTEYVLACTEYMHHINASSNLEVKGMESPLWQSVCIEKAVECTTMYYIISHTGEFQDKPSTYLYVLRQTWYILKYNSIY